MDTGNQFAHVKNPKDAKESDGFQFLPDVFVPAKKEDFHKREVCEECEKKFSIGVSRHHCRRCAKSVCEPCSRKRRLSKCDADLHYACLSCDFEVSNGVRVLDAMAVLQERNELVIAVISD